MITYAERACFCASHLRALKRAQQFVGRVSNTWGNELRCHELARALRAVLGDRTLFVVDGTCGGIEHSWLTFPDGAILDTYAPGRLPAVQLVDGRSVVGVAYRAGEARRDIRRSILRRLVLEMRGRPPVS